MARREKSLRQLLHKYCHSFSLTQRLEQEKKEWEEIEKEIDEASALPVTQEEQKEEQKEEPASSSSVSSSNKQTALKEEELSQFEKEEPMIDLKRTLQTLILQVDEIQPVLKNIQHFSTVTDHMCQDLFDAHRRRDFGHLPNLDNPKALIRTVTHP